MKMLRREEERENRIYIIIWITVFFLLALRVVMECIVRKEGGVDFGAILGSWLRAVPYLLLFAFHNYLIAPLLIYKKQVWGYIALTVLLFGAFVAYVFLLRDNPGPGMAPPEPAPWEDGFMPHMPDGRAWRPLSPEMLNCLLGLMLVAANLGAKFYFHGEYEKMELARLEKENLSHQLESLRYQINPHFFMNTLNNIHALVDIDPEKAKESIVELSKLMRHVLYDSNRATIPLGQDLEFLDNYVALMRMRFGDNLQIEYSRPPEDNGAEVPPLAFASFVENAFKHGLSYEKESFVRISVAVESGKVLFNCVNSQSGRPRASEKGVGLENSRHRFELLYGDAFVLHMENKPDTYSVLLVIPAKPTRLV
ncbi:MAG: histidine kinase [Bacteroidales bacterium]|nr:histidine kinase [Bacteroidales bacterium]